MSDETPRSDVDGPIVHQDEVALVRRVLQYLSGIRSAARRSEKARKILMGLALVAFLAMGAVALKNYPSDVAQSPNWVLLVAIGIVGPTLTVLANSEEYRVQGRMVDVPIGRIKAVQVTVVATAANLLPIPGSLVVRTQALSSTAGYRAAIRTTTMAGAVWLFATVLLGGVSLLFIGLPLVGALLILVGSLGLVLCGWYMRRTTPRWRRRLLELFLVETATSVIGAARLLVILLALGLDVSVGQAVALTMSGVIASATGIFPAGLGVREAVAAGIASAVSLPASLGFVATAADRIAGLVVLAVASGAILVMKPTSIETQPVRGDDESHTT